MADDRFLSPRITRTVDLAGRPPVSLVDLHELLLAPLFDQPQPRTVTVDERANVASRKSGKTATSAAMESASKGDPASRRGSDASVRRCAISGRPESYLRATTRGAAALAGPQEAAGPLAGSTLTITNTLGNLRVHTHDGGVQVWVLSYERGAPRWVDVSKSSGHPHPALQGYVLGYKSGQANPSWVKSESYDRYGRASRPPASDGVHAAVSEDR